MQLLPRLRKLLPLLLAAASFSILNPSAFAKYLRFGAGAVAGPLPRMPGRRVAFLSSSATPRTTTSPTTSVGTCCTRT